MMSLDAIALATGTDRASTGHGYTRLYESVLYHLKSRECTLLEIGVWEGAGVQMWAAWMQLATVVGVDRDLSRYRFEQNERILLRQGDAYNTEYLATLTAEFSAFDVIIDDGSHRVGDQLIAYETLWPRLVPGGLYIIEDLHTYWWSHANPPGSVQWLHSLADQTIGMGLERWQREHDIEWVLCAQSVVVIRKKG